MILVHASALEIIWLLMAVVCITVTTINMLSARADRNRSANSPVPSLVFLTQAIYTSTRVILTTKTVILLAAIWAVFKPPPPPDIWTLPQSFANVIAWITISTLLTIHASLSMHWRIKLGGTFGASSGRRATDAVITQKTEEIKEVIVEKANEIKDTIEPIKTTVERVDKTVNGLTHDGHD